VTATGTPFGLPTRGKVAPGGETPRRPTKPLLTAVQPHLFLRTVHPHLPPHVTTTARSRVTPTSSNTRRPCRPPQTHQSADESTGHNHFSSLLEDHNPRRSKVAVRKAHFRRPQAMHPPAQQGCGSPRLMIADPFADHCTGTEPEMARPLFHARRHTNEPAVFGWQLARRPHRRLGLRFSARCPGR
jgi:hypothetical protein